ncbi:ParB N-terminal domain-containing protein [Leucobacter sp. wl10]|uniref:ParB/RepB/Spo0J family partition protein n=1 Tax=Leucobacter sp. wl10 TaxID=2304677 RepID=UPI000E5B62AD|nr:ParB N-terminal domain-containing protein [Leucobacter sp. wl10]RGE19080.1 chromosome partitioning protein [Leucobacter sp. wl10]
MTDIAELGTIEYLDPNDIEVDPNVRFDVRLNREFIRSIEQRGVLMPVVCRRMEGKVSVRMGQRRVLGARAAGRIVPARVVEGDDTTVERILDQFAENEHRAALTEPERAAVFQQLAFEGLSVPQIAKQTGVKRAVVEAGITVADSDFAGKIATKHEVTLDQAAAILEFEGDKEAVKRLVECAEHSPEQFPHELQRQRDERQRREIREQAEAEVKEQGFQILDREPGYYDKTPVPLHELIDLRTGDPVTVEQLTGLTGAAAHVRVYVDGEVAIGYYLDDPKAHGFKKRPQNGAASGPMTDEQKAERRQLIANNKAWASAEAVRREWLAAFLGRRTLPKDATRFIATMLTTHRRRIAGALGDANRMASTFLGLAEPENYWEASPLDALVQQQPGKAGHAALAVVLASIESTTGKATWRHPDQAAECYFTQLDTWGYPLSEVEQIVIGVDSTTEAEADPTPAETASEEEADTAAGEA